MLYEEVLKQGLYKENSEKEDDMVMGLFYRWRKYGYLLEPKQETMYSLIAKKICAEKAYNKFVLDAGCGVGVGSIILYRKAGFVTGFDKSKSNIEFAKKIFPIESVEFIQKDIAYFDPNTFYVKFEMIVCVEVIEHIKYYNQALLNLQNRLNKGGVLYISSPNRNNSELGKETPNNISHVREWTLEEFEEILKVFFNKVELFNYDFSELKTNKETPILAVCKNE